MRFSDTSRSDPQPIWSKPLYIELFGHRHEFGPAYGRRCLVVVQTVAARRKSATAYTATPKTRAAMTTPTIARVRWEILTAAPSRYRVRPSCRSGLLHAPQALALGPDPGLGQYRGLLGSDRLSSLGCAGPRDDIAVAIGQSSGSIPGLERRALAWAANQTRPEGWSVSWWLALRGRGRHTAPAVEAGVPGCRDCLPATSIPTPRCRPRSPAHTVRRGFHRWRWRG